MGRVLTYRKKKDGALMCERVMMDELVALIYTFFQYLIPIFFSFFFCAFYSLHYD